MIQSRAGEFGGRTKASKIETVVGIGGLSLNSNLRNITCLAYDIRDPESVFSLGFQYAVIPVRPERATPAGRRPI